MTEQEFLEHHKLTRNPFADEDAQTDTVFKEHCIEATFHPAWSKVYGDPLNPATAIVIGPKGSGKTAMRLQITKHLNEHNKANPDKRVFVVQYDDFNSYLGPLQQSLPKRVQTNPDKVLQSVRIWDHIDGILCQSVTSLVDRILNVEAPSDNQTYSIDAGKIDKLDRSQKRDLLLLAACYDQSRMGTFDTRFASVRKKLRYSNWSAWQWWAVGLFGSLLTLLLGYGLVTSSTISKKSGLIMVVLLLLASWAPYLYRTVRLLILARQLRKNIRVGRRETVTLAHVLGQIPSNEIAAQPLPTSARSDDRYAMLEKFQMLLRSIGFDGIIVLIDRVDEPDIVNGRAERIKSLVWPLLDNKLLKHTGLGIKLLLPSDLQYFLDRETREFNERARLDKQNLINNFDWTGESLYDVLGARMKACATTGATTSPKDLFDENISEQRLVLAMLQLRTPRSLFRFMYKLVAEHCKRHRSSDPQYKISGETFESTLAVYQTELAQQSRTP